MFDESHRAGTGNNPLSDADHLHTTSQNGSNNKKKRKKKKDGSARGSSSSTAPLLTDENNSNRTYNTNTSSTTTTSSDSSGSSNRSSPTEEDEESSSTSSDSSSTENLPIPPNATHEKIKLGIAATDALLSAILYYKTTSGVSAQYIFSCLLANFGFDSLAAYSTENANRNPAYGDIGIFSKTEWTWNPRNWANTPHQRLFLLGMTLGFIFSIPAPIIVASGKGDLTEKILSAGGNEIGTFFLYIFATLKPARAIRNFYNYYLKYWSSKSEKQKEIKDLYTIENELLKTLGELAEKVGNGRKVGLEKGYPFQNANDEDSDSSSESPDASDTKDSSDEERDSTRTHAADTNPHQQTDVTSSSVYEELPENPDAASSVKLTLPQQKLFYLAQQAAVLDDRIPSPCCATPHRDIPYYFGAVVFPILSCIASLGYATSVGMVIAAAAGPYAQLFTGLAFNLGMFSLSAQSAIGLYNDVINWCKNPRRPELVELLGLTKGLLAMAALAYIGSTSGASGQNLQELYTMPLLDSFCSSDSNILGNNSTAVYDYFSNSTTGNNTVVSSCFSSITTGLGREIFSKATFYFIGSTNLFFIMGAAVAFTGLYLAFRGTQDQKRSLACQKELANCQNELSGSPDRTQEFADALSALDDTGCTVTSKQGEEIKPSKALLRDKASRQAYQNYYLKKHSLVPVGGESQMTDMSTKEIEVRVDDNPGNLPEDGAALFEPKATPRCWGFC